MRGMTVTRVALSDCSVLEIASITGHSMILVQEVLAPKRSQPGPFIPRQHTLVAAPWCPFRADRITLAVGRPLRVNPEQQTFLAFVGMFQRGDYRTSGGWNLLHLASRRRQHAGG